MKKTIRLLALVMVFAALLTMFAGCKGKKDVGDKTVIHFAACGVSAADSPYYQELINTYNTTQGEIDRVYVEMAPKSEQINGLDVALRSNYLYDVVEVYDDQYKALVL